MSWLAKRETTRIEDMAYCMLGLFDINMPLLYGEGAKAFLRLQEEIIRRYNDHTIFAWATDHAADGFLALSPKAFTSAGSIRARRRGGSPQLASPWSITNAGISINLPVISTSNIEIVILEGFDQNMHPYLGIMLGGPRGQKMLSRAGLPFPLLRVCGHLFSHFPVRSLYLQAFDRPGLLKYKQNVSSSHVSPVKPLRHQDRHGILMSFPSQLAGTKPSLRFFPDSVCLDGIGAFEFPTGEEACLVTELDSFNVRTTGAAIVLSSLRQEGLKMLFTMSIVTSKPQEKWPTRHIYSHFQLTDGDFQHTDGNFQLTGSDFQPTGSDFQLTGSNMDLVDEWWRPYGEWHEPAYALDPSSPKHRLVQTEHRRVVSAATSLSMDYTASPSTSRSAPEKEWTIDGVVSSKIQIGCCDMLNPSFTSLRLAVIWDPIAAAPIAEEASSSQKISSVLSCGMPT